jgi:hypothetical protein
MTTYAEAVINLVGIENFIGGSTDGPIDEIKLVDGTTPPTEEAIQAKLAELQAEYEENQYQRDRAVAYPSYADQLDTIYHQGLDAWKAEIKKVKDQFPKPE